MLKRTSRSRDSGLRKRESFVRKFLKVKRKPEEEEEGEREPEKEVVRKEEKDKIEDETSLQMLNELKKMIVGKKNKNEVNILTKNYYYLYCIMYYNIVY